MLYLKMAWRNIWRNKRRTFITMMSVVMAVLLSSIMRSMQEGQYDQMIDNTVGTFVGHLQVQANDYYDEPTLNNSFEASDTFLARFGEVEGVKAVIPRIESYALAAGHERSKAAMVVGIDVVAERSLSKPQSKIVKGTYFQENTDPQVLISEGLGDFLNMEVGDTLVLIGQGYHGMSAASAYPIRGIMKFGIPDLNKGMVYLPLGTAQDFYGAYGQLTAAVILLQDTEQLQENMEEIHEMLAENLVVLSWQKLMPELVQAIQADKGSGYILFLILYMVVGFGIFGTILMMTAERKFEFGVMIAIGTAKYRMVLILILEMIFITFAGALSGMILSLPFIYYFHFNPLEFTGEAARAIEEYGMEPFIQFSTDPTILLNQGIIILIITMVISLYPVLHMHKLKPVEAMRL